MNTFLKVHPTKYYTQQKDEECGLNSDDTVNEEFSRLPELDSEVGERKLEIVEQLVVMQENLNKYGSTVGLKFALDVTMEDEFWQPNSHFR